MPTQWGDMTLEEALARIEELETENEGLKTEKTALLRKRDELLGKVRSLKDLEATGATVEEISELRDIKTKFEAGTQDQGKASADIEAIKATFDKRLAAIEAERNQEKAEREQERKAIAAEKLRAAAVLELSKPDYGLFAPEQFHRLVGDKIRLNDAGQLVTGDEYDETSLDAYIKTLKTQPEYQHHFKATGVTGSGSNPSTGGATGSGSTNPWKKESFNLTLQGKILKENPGLAASLRAAAGK